MPGMVWESKPGFYFKQNSDCEWFEYRDDLQFKIFESSNLTQHKLYLHTNDYTVVIDETKAWWPDYSQDGKWIKGMVIFLFKSNNTRHIYMFFQSYFQSRSR